MNWTPQDAQALLAAMRCRGTDLSTATISQIGGEWVLDVRTRFVLTMAEDGNRPAREPLGRDHPDVAALHEQLAEARATGEFPDYVRVLEARIRAKGGRP